MKTSYIAILALIVLAATVLSYLEQWIRFTEDPYEVAYIAAALFAVTAVIIIRQRKKQVVLVRS